MFVLGVLTDEPAFQSLPGMAVSRFRSSVCTCLRHYPPDPIITHPALRPDPEASAAGKYR